LNTDKLPSLLELKYRTIADGLELLGCSIGSIRSSFIDFQGYLYEEAA
jgi:hypothetical protein